MSLKRLKFSLLLGALLWTLTGCDDDPSSTLDAEIDTTSDVDSGTIVDVESDPYYETPPCLAPRNADSTGTDQLDDSLGTTTVVIDDRDACRRSYTLSTTAALRDNLPANPRSINERRGWPTLRTGHDLFDALYALALKEVRENSVAQIQNGSFDQGNPVSCGEGGCFETGRLWTYVWTRDISYSVHLGLAALDPVRALNSLSFKLSERREGGDLQIVQDTGSGGSYPISSDRVAWALGAWELLAHLDGDERESFGERAYDALQNTVEHDRDVVFDEVDGLYRGEQSFLDWREQSYPEWTARDTVHIGMSKSLSTNLLHLRALEITAALAEEAGDAAEHDRYSRWADDLRESIREFFWLEDEGLFSTFSTTFLDPVPASRFDLLGSALAVLFGVTDNEQAGRILESYPHYGHGAPVMWPQLLGIPIYHNRGEWPFVSAYWLRAARLAGNDAVADRMVATLVRGAALNLSNMENFEAGSGDADFDDGSSTGPVVNSQRQLWSVAGYISMVHHTIFGLQAEPTGLRVEPYLTAGLRNGMFAGTDTLVLNDYPFRGRTVSVLLHLPPGDDSGSYSVSSVSLNGSTIEDTLVSIDSLVDSNRIDITLEANTTSDESAITIVPADDTEDLFGPRTPIILGIERDDANVRLDIRVNSEDQDIVTLDVFRDGQLVASDLPGTTGSWTDSDTPASSSTAACYVVEAINIASGNHSQRSFPVCWRGDGGQARQTVGASSFVATGGTPVTEFGRFHYADWGDVGDELEVSSFVPSQTGPHVLSVLYGNGAGPINTGIACGVKRIVVENDSGEVVADGPLLMPQLNEWSRWEESSFVRADLEAGETYRIVIRGDEQMINMSWFAHFELYGGTGGRSGMFNRVNIAEVRVMAR